MVFQLNPPSKPYSSSWWAYYFNFVSFGIHIIPACICRCTNCRQKKVLVVGELPEHSALPRHPRARCRTPKDSNRPPTMRRWLIQSCTSWLSICTWAASLSMDKKVTEKKERNKMANYIDSYSWNRRLSPDRHPLTQISTAKRPHTLSWGNATDN